MNHWPTNDIPPQAGKRAAVTGATGGIGYETALELARAGAEVLVLGRNEEKGRAAVVKIRRTVLHAKVRFEQVDLADLDSIGRCAQRLLAENRPLDLLVNNAGVMNPPKRLVTKDGFELQFGTNYLAHFALTGLLLPLLRQGNDARVVHVSSIAGREGFIDFEDLQAERGYKPMRAYSQSKLANLLFSFELQRRSEAAGWNISSIAAHPGVSRTDLLPNGAGKSSLVGIVRRVLWFLFQPAAQGALPVLYAATSPDAAPGGYYGPNKLGETRGFPAEAKAPPQSLDAKVAGLLWERSQYLSAVTFE